MCIDTDGHLAQCEYERDAAETAFEAAYEMGVENQADWLMRNRRAIEDLLSDYKDDITSGIHPDVADDVYNALDHAFDLRMLADIGMQIGG